MDAFLGIIKCFAKFIGITRDEELPSAANSGEASSPRLFTRVSPPGQPEEKRPSFFCFLFFLPFFSAEKEKPAGKPSTSAPVYRTPPQNASFMLTYYVQGNDAGKIESYFKENGISRMNLTELNVAESPLTLAARKGSVDSTRALLQHVTLDNVKDSLHALARMPPHERDHPGMTKCAKALVTHIQTQEDYLAALRKVEKPNLLPEQIAWINEMGEAPNRATRTVPN